LQNNNISGFLPPYLSTFYNLRYVYLDNNSFVGPVPSEWCDGGWWIFDVRSNPGTAHMDSLQYFCMVI
jgi:hypothetical protein